MSTPESRQHNDEPLGSSSFSMQVTLPGDWLTTKINSWNLGTAS